MFPSVGGTGVLWWLYVDHRKALDNATTSVFGKEVVADNVKALLIYAIISTVFTVRSWLDRWPSKTTKGDRRDGGTLASIACLPQRSLPLCVCPSPYATPAQMLQLV